MKNRKNNKGFSLVELIVVVAIMAVLVGVLAPAYLRYVEKTRLQKDNSAIAEMANAMKVAAADEAINNIIPAAGYVVTIDNSANGNATVSFDNEAAGGDAMEVELNAVMGASFTTASKTYKTSGTDITLTLSTDNNGKTSVAVAGLITTPNSTTTSTATY